VPDITFTDVISVEVLSSNFSDEMVCLAARTSTAGADADPARTKGLINALMRDRHGTPFEHMNATFRVRAPLFVWREHHRHRAGWSYNEESGRYKVLDPVFYVPGPDRHITQVGKAMEYATEPGTAPQRHLVRGAIEAASEDAYSIYAELLGAGIMREVARMVLPVNIMSTCVVTCNARSLMHFLSLRQRHDDAQFPSKPMAEINIVADGYEMCLAESAPLVHEAFVTNGRVAP
jgi:thymidylate synthase (FAD)